MKIKKFDESKSDELDISYFKFIFSEFLDEGAEDGTGEIEEEYYEIFIKEPNLKKTSTFDYYEENIKEVYDFSNNLKSCIGRIKDEYPDIKIEFDFEEFWMDREGMLERTIHLIFTL